MTEKLFIRKGHRLFMPEEKVAKKGVQNSGQALVRSQQWKVRNALTAILGTAAAFAGITGMAIESSHNCGGCNACMPPPIERREKRKEDKDDSDDSLDEE